MEAYLNGSEKQTAVIQDYKEYHTDVTVKFIVQVNTTIPRFPIKMVNLIFFI